ncbi:MAG: hypothetical protein JO281_20560 [Pseudonocardiales bacterium]|nr:hypothetical protein [Pseudonocardiales bacterium]
MSGGTTRCLDEVEIDYLFLDSPYFWMHVGARADPVLAAWGITTAGARVLIGLGPCGSESTDAPSGIKAAHGQIFEPAEGIGPGQRIERAFGETRHRAKVIGRLPGETSCLSLVWAILDRASRC